MPTWGEVLGEITSHVKAGEPNGPDLVRRKYTIELYKHRKRAVILYATKWTQSGGPVPPDMLSITDEDLQALMTVMNGIQETALDLILHSPGGSIEAAEALVTYLRSKFSDICVIVPQQAMSAATMIACAANNIILGKHSFLGPTDPQFILQTELGLRIVTAQNIEEQFEQAQEQCADPSKIGAWIPILRQYGPDLLQKCRNASDLSRTLIKGWLRNYMFKGEAGAGKKAAKISQWLSSHKHFKTHGRHLNRQDLRAKGMDKIIDLESDPTVQDLVLSVFHATTITFDMTAGVKLIENHLGKAFVKMVAPPGMMTPPPPRPKPNP
jgi:ATP-dependent protease ClpP protease subunit